MGKGLKTALIALGVGAWIIAPGMVSRDKTQVFEGLNVAHRGLHTKDKSIPENSLPAFDAACENGYGIELDVQLSKDGEVVVFHDDTLNRVCGVDSRVDGKTLEELKALSLCGTKETIPLFSEVLDVVKGRAPLIVELKKSPKTEELCKKTLALLRAYDGPFCIESFDPRIVTWFRFNAPDIVRGQLACKRADYGKGVSPVMAYILEHCLLNFAARPHFIAYDLVELPLTVKLMHKMGAMRVCWTSHEEGNEVNQDTVIFEFYHPATHFL